jgi:hypothetical protein
MYLLDTERDKTAESTSNSWKAEPVCHSQANLVLGIEKGWENGVHLIM